MNCKPYCHITTGFSGAGAFSDGKLSLSPDVGGDFPDLIGYTLAQELIHYTDGIYLEFGADTKIEGISDPEKVKHIRKRAIQAGLKLVDCPIPPFRNRTGSGYLPQTPDLFAGKWRRNSFWTALYQYYSAGRYMQRRLRQKMPQEIKGPWSYSLRKL